MNKAKEHDEEDSLILHLTELRSRLLKCVLAMLAMVPLAAYFNDPIFSFIIAPIQPHLHKLDTSLVFSGLMDKFVIYMKVGIASVILFSSPVCFYQLWKFVEPGLYEHERKYGILFVISAILLFLMGAAFAYYLVFPITFEYLLNLGDPTIRPMLNISDYLSFVIFMALGIGFVFELPVFFAILAMLGIIDADFLIKSRRYAIVAMAIVSAVITPSPDPISMFMVLIPLVILYEISILVVRLIARREEVGTDMESNT